MDKVEWHKRFTETRVAVVDGLVLTMTHTRTQEPGSLPVPGKWYGHVTRVTDTGASVTLLAAEDDDVEGLTRQLGDWLSASLLARERDPVPNAYPVEKPTRGKRKR